MLATNKSKYIIVLVMMKSTNCTNNSKGLMLAAAIAKAARGSECSLSAAHTNVKLSAIESDSLPLRSA